MDDSVKSEYSDGSEPPKTMKENHLKRLIEPLERYLEPFSPLLS